MQDKTPTDRNTKDERGSQTQNRPRLLWQACYTTLAPPTPSGSGAIAHVVVGIATWDKQRWAAAPTEEHAGHRTYLFGQCTNSGLPINFPHTHTLALPIVS